VNWLLITPGEGYVLTITEAADRQQARAQLWGWWYQNHYREGRAQPCRFHECSIEAEA
jgi:hypothetical protein